MSTHSIILSTFIALLFAVGGTRASELPGDSLVGREVRIVAPAESDTPLRGKVVSHSADSLGLMRTDSQSLLNVPMDAITFAEVRTGSSSRSRELAVAGLALGAMVDRLIIEENKRKDAARRGVAYKNSVSNLLLSAVIGCTVGAAIGAAIRTEHWEDLPVAGLRPDLTTSSGHVSLQLSLKF